jgi:putative SOS response-associated peptidase YedK
MCNEYRTGRSQAEIHSHFRVKHDRAGNLEQLHFFPDRLAPIIRNDAGGDREMVKMRWGFPNPKPGGVPVTNLREPSKPYWRPWLEVQCRCIVPWDAFCEWTDDLPKRRKWFALAQDRPLAAFAGVWRVWEGTRGPKSDPVTGEHLLFTFMTTSPNELVAPVHRKAMPVLLSTEDDVETWLTAPPDEALKLQRPFPAERMVILPDAAPAQASLL